MHAKKNNPRIFVGVTEVAGYCMNLFIGFRKNNIRAGYINLSNNTFSYTGYQPFNHPLLNYVSSLAQRSASKKMLRPWYFLLKTLTFIWTLFKYDVFIFATGSTFYKYYDYKLLKLLGKKIIHVSLGSDSRPQYLNGNFKDSPGEKITPQQIENKNQSILALIHTVEKYADIIINYPQHAHFHKRSFISGNFIGFPSRDITEIAEIAAPSDRKVRILHAPTRPKAKGSIYFNALLKELKEEGYDFEYVQITNKTNTEVKKEITQSDIILDELYSDLPLGGLGAEAASMGKAVVVGGYYADLIYKEMDSHLIPPSCYCLPEELKDKLANLIRDAKSRADIGKALQRYISTEWNGIAVAERYLSLIQNNYPQEWNCSPTSLNYLWGWGMSKEEIIQLISVQVNTLGLSSLHLSHNPQLESAYSSLVEEVRV